MKHWLMVGQDIWAVLRWPLPIFLIFMAGIGVVKEPRSDLAFYLFLAGGFSYLAAMLGWWVR